MRKIIFQLVVIFGAISNAITMGMMTSNPWIVIGTTTLYVIVFEAIFIYMQPRLITADRKRNIQKYPLLRQFIHTDRAILKLLSGETIYNASFIGYSTPKETNLIEIEIHRPKQAKKPAYTENKIIHIAEIVEVKSMKR